MLHGLNHRSSLLAAALFSAFPDWVRFARVQHAGSLLVDVPSPGNPCATLYVDTLEEDCTVSFAGWHIHLPSYANGEATYQRALELIREIHEERRVVVRTYEGGRWTGTHAAAPNAVPPAGPGRTVQVFSWKGTYNVEQAA